MNQSSSPRTMSRSEELAKKANNALAGLGKDECPSFHGKVSIIGRFGTELLRAVSQRKDPTLSKRICSDIRAPFLAKTPWDGLFARAGEQHRLAARLNNAYQSRHSHLPGHDRPLVHQPPLTPCITGRWHAYARPAKHERRAAKRALI